MIVSLLFYLITGVLTIILSFLQGITLVFSSIVPNQIYTAIAAAVNYLGFFQGVFPIDTLIFCLSTLAIFFTAFYFVRIGLFVWSLVPFLGTRAELPRDNIVDLRKGKKFTIRTMKDIQ